jgi:putative PEP-CTERM system TPR-repeat lipoprotein
LTLVLPLCLQLAACDKSSTDYMALAKTSLQAKDSAAALLHLKNVLAKEPNNAEARVLTGEALIANGDPAGAVIEFKRARELKADENRVVPLLAEALLLNGESRLLVEQLGAVKLGSPEAAAKLTSSLAQAHLALKRVEKAREVVDAALKLAPSSQDARLTLARVQVAEGKPTEALATIDALVKDVPGFDDAWAMKGFLHENAGAQEEALAAYAKTLQINPKQIEALYSGAMVQIQRGDLKAARDAYTKLAAAWPRNPNTMYVDARITHLEGKYAAARPVFAALLNMAPENVPTLIASGLNELKLDAPIQAEAQLARAVSLAPTNSNARYLLAQSEIRLGRPDKATAALAPLLEGQNATAGVLVIAAQAKLMQGDPTGADQLFNRAAKLPSKDTGVRTALAAARMGRQGEADAALRELEQISQVSESTDADFRIISARLARNEVKDALAAIVQLEKKAPNLPAGPELRGQALKLMGDLPGARKAFEDALQRDKAYAPALAQLTAMDMKEGKPEQARQRLTAVLAADRDNSQALTMLAALSVRTGSTSAEVLELLDRATKADPLNLNAWMTLLMRHFQAGDFQAAMLASQSATKAIPDNVQLMDLTGRIQLAAGSTNQANSTFADLIRVAPRNAAGYMGLATTLLAVKDLESAGKVIQRLVALNPNDIDAQRMAAEVSVLRRQYGDALAVARNLQRTYPADAAGFLLEAQIEAAQNHRPATIAALRATVKRSNPQAAPVRLHEELLLNGDKAQAQEFADDWMKQHPKDALFLAYLGDVEAEAKNWPAASNLYDRALQIDGNNVPALNNGAMAQLKLGQEAKALEYAQRALVVQPNRPEVLDTLAQIYASRKDYPKATAALRAAIARATNPSPLQYSLAQIYIAAEDPASAMTELQVILDRGKTNPLYAQARKQLADLRRR